MMLNQARKMNTEDVSNFTMDLREQAEVLLEMSAFQNNLSNTQLMFHMGEIHGRLSRLVSNLFELEAWANFK